MVAAEILGMPSADVPLIQKETVLAKEPEFR